MFMDSPICELLDIVFKLRTSKNLGIYTFAVNINTNECQNHYISKQYLCDIFVAINTIY